MPRRRKNETEKERKERVEKTEQQTREDIDQEDNSLDAMVRRSIKLHGP